MWSLSPDVYHLNHGSFGAVPIEVQEKQIEWRSRWEANPTRFVYSELNDGLEESRTALAGFVGASLDGLAFVRNASLGVAAVARSIEPHLEPGDEIVTTRHDYNAVRQTLEFTAARREATVRVVEVPFPIDSQGTVTRLVLDAVTKRTKLVVVDHITSPTGLIFPVEAIVSALEPDIPVLVDGAHGPGQVPLDVASLGASWYTGNLHKWVCAPKGAAFLSTREDHIGETVPTVISHAWNAPALAGPGRYRALFDWTGTDDFTPWLVIPDVLTIVGNLEDGGWSAVMKRNHELALAARDMVCALLDIPHPAPDEMIGSMPGIPLGKDGGDDQGVMISPLNQQLLDDGFETLVSFWPRWPDQVLRLSAHLYNTLDQYAALTWHLNGLVGGRAPRPDLGSRPGSS